MKKFLLAFFVLATVCSVRYLDPWFMEVVRLKALDIHQQQQDPIELQDIVTVTIDNKTVRKYGQWPWSRDILAREIDRLHMHGAGLIVMPILFADKDRFGKDSDFVKQLQRVVVGQIPSSGESGGGRYGNPVARGVSQIGLDWQPWLYSYDRAVGPIKEIGDAAAGVGMTNTTPEADGVVRRLPLVVRIGDKMYPSIAIETLRAAIGVPSYDIKTGDGGVEKIRVKGFKVITTDANASIWLDFKYKTKTYSLSEQLPDLRGKIVILSPTASGIDTVVPTPVGAIYAHDVIATSIGTMMSGVNITRPYWSNIAELGATFVIGLILVIIVLKLPWVVSLQAMPVLVVGSYFVSFYLFTNHGYLIDWSFPAFALFVAWAVAAFLRFILEYRLRQQIKKQFEHYLDPRQVAVLQKNPDMLKLGGDRREMSFLFMDIVGFTPISEHYKNNDDPEGLVECINDYLDRMTKIVLDNGGTVDKYMGDCIMAFWNAPLPCDNHAEMAVKTAMECAIETEDLKRAFAEKGLPEINIGSGVNTGTCIVGNMGSSTRFDYSVIGDAVNLAARLEAATRNYKTETGNVTPVILSSYTQEQLPKEFTCVELDKIKVKGKEELVTIYSPKF
jgi:adenylate cyclase